MPDFTVDFSSTKSDYGSLVSPGRYEAHISKVTLRQKAEEGANPYLNVEVTIDEGIGAPNPEEFKGRKLFAIQSFSPKTLGRTKAFLESCGADVSGEATLKVESQGADQILVTPNLIGEAVRIRVSPDTDQDGEPRSKIQTIFGKHGRSEENGQARTTTAAAGSSKRTYR